MSFAGTSAAAAGSRQVPALITNLKVATTQAQLPVMALEGAAPLVETVQEGLPWDGDG